MDTVQFDSLNILMRILLNFVSRIIYVGKRFVWWQFFWYFLRERYENEIFNSNYPCFYYTTMSFAIIIICLILFGFWLRSEIDTKYFFRFFFIFFPFDYRFLLFRLKFICDVSFLYTKFIATTLQIFDELWIFHNDLKNLHTSCIFY